MNRKIIILVHFFYSYLLAQDCSEVSEFYESVGIIGPKMALIYNDSIYQNEVELPVLENLSSDNRLSIKLSLPYPVKESLHGMIFYKIHGISLYKTSRIGSNQLIYQDKSYTNQLDDTLIYSFKELNINQDGMGGKFLISMDSVILIDCKGNSHHFSNDWFHDTMMEFSIKGKSSLVVGNNGFPKLKLLVNNAPYQKDREILKTDELVLLVSFQDNAQLNSQFSVSGLIIEEQACFGPIERMKISESQLPLKIPHDRLIPGFGGEYYIVVDELYYNTMNGNKYRIELLHKDYFIKFNKPIREN